MEHHQGLYQSVRQDFFKVIAIIAQNIQDLSVRQILDDQSSQTDPEISRPKNNFTKGTSASMNFQKS